MLTSQLRCQWLSEASGPPCTPTPALEQKISTCPNYCVVSSTRRFTSDSLATLVTTGVPFTSAATRFAFCSSISATTTFAPSAAKARQRACPMPLAPPVTTTTRFCICMQETINAEDGWVQDHGESGDRVIAVIG